MSMNALFNGNNECKYLEKLQYIPASQLSLAEKSNLETTMTKTTMMTMTLTMALMSKVTMTLTMTMTTTTTMTLVIVTEMSVMLMSVMMIMVTVTAVNSMSIPRFIRSDQLRSAHRSNTIPYKKSLQTSKCLYP